MEISEAIERIKTMAFMCDDFHNCKYGHDCTDGCSEAVKMAVDALQGSVKKKHIGSDNMVISSSDLMTILNSDSEELKQYKEVGTVEEFKVLKEKNEPKKILYRKQSYGTPWLCPYCEADQIKVEFFSEDGSEPKEKYTFCWQCGTRIDWSE